MSLQFHMYSERSVLIKWKDASLKLQDKVSFINALKDHYDTRAVINSGAHSLLVLFLEDVLLEDLKTELLQIFKGLKSKPVSYTSWNIPMCVDFEDLEFEKISNQIQFTKTELLEIHLNTTYTVEFIGFLPGFPYLSGLDPRLQLPRKKTPSRLITSGTVAIANDTCGIYPQDSPAGWYGIGRCPLKLFSPEKDQPTLLQLGDHIYSSNFYGTVD